MQHNFMLFSELQKRVSPSPIKTWRLLDRMRADGRMREGDDFRKIDRKLYVNVPRFVVELEAMGYAVKSDDFKTGDVKSDEINKLIEEVRLISTEIIDEKIQREMQQSDEESSSKDPQVKSSDIKNIPPTENTKSDEIRYESQPRRSDGISPTVISSEINLKSPEFNLLLQGKDEIIASKKEQIETMRTIYTEILESKDKMLKSKDDALAEVRSALDTVVKQNETLVHQNVYLTRLLTAPHEERAAPKHAGMNSHDIRDISDAELEPDPGEPESPAPPMHESSAPTEHHAPREVHVVSEQDNGDQNPPEDSTTSVS